MLNIQKLGITLALLGIFCFTTAYYSLRVELTQTKAELKESKRTNELNSIELSSCLSNLENLNDKVRKIALKPHNKPKPNIKAINELNTADINSTNSKLIFYEKLFKELSNE